MNQSNSSQVHGLFNANPWAEEDDFEYGGRSTRSVSHSLIITLLPSCFNDDIKIKKFCL